MSIAVTCNCFILHCYYHHFDTCLFFIVTQCITFSLNSAWGSTLSFSRLLSHFLTYVHNLLLTWNIILLRDLFSMFLLLPKKKTLVCIFLTHITDISSLLRGLSELVGVNDVDDKVWKDNKVLPAKSINKKIIMHFSSLLLCDLLLWLVGEKIHYKKGVLNHVKCSSVNSPH